MTRARPRPARSRLVMPLVASLLVALAAGACGPGTSATPGPVGSASLGTAATSLPEPDTLPVTGVLTGIEATSLTNVTAITLRTVDGAQVTFRIGVLENGAEFPPGHLTEHMATSAPVRVFFRDEAGTLVVYRIEDAE